MFVICSRALILRLQRQPVRLNARQQRVLQLGRAGRIQLRIERQRLHAAHPGGQSRRRRCVDRRHAADRRQRGHAAEVGQRQLVAAHVRLLGAAEEVLHARIRALDVLDAIARHLRQPEVQDRLGEEADAAEQQAAVEVHARIDEATALQVLRVQLIVCGVFLAQVRADGVTVRDDSAAVVQHRNCVGWIELRRRWVLGNVT